jgi:DNA repair protein RecO (recombination protein O)
LARIAHEPGFLLHARAYRETSALLDVFTRAHGRVGLIYKGAKRNPKRGVDLQPFCRLNISWAGKGELRTLTGLEANGPRGLATPRLKVCGLYLNELIFSLVPRNSPAAELYRCYEATLAALNSGAEIEPLLRQFELYLLQTSGYGPLLEHEAAGERMIDPEARYFYDNEQGPVRIPPDGAANGLLISGRTLLALQRAQRLDTESARESKLLLRGIIDYQLRGKPLMSREIMKYLERAGA